MFKLKSLETINSSNRNSSIDVFRGLAIISVVIYHYNYTFELGFLGVDLFFIVSGLLVGGILTKEFEEGKKINFLKFFLQRGLKIWPSYYFLLFFGNFIAYLLYSKTNPSEIIPSDGYLRYILFYRNYSGLPKTWSFVHTWSLCVEEHFYILLPIMFLLVQNFISKNNQKKALYFFVLLTILFGILAKPFSFYILNQKDTYSATHDRIDALAWGVLLNLLIKDYGPFIRKNLIRFSSIVAGLIICSISIYYFQKLNSLVYNEVYFHSIIVLSFFLILLGVYSMDFQKLKPIRFVAYFSYNWYLWHPIFVIFITNHLGNTLGGLFLYIIITFCIAIITTILIEEKFLEKRSWILNRIFSK